jgi:hypothetical protein
MLPSSSGWIDVIIAFFGHHDCVASDVKAPRSHKSEVACGPIQTRPDESSASV